MTLNECIGKRYGVQCLKIDVIALEVGFKKTGMQPLAPTRFFALTRATSERGFLPNEWSTPAHPSPANSNRTSVQINWNESIIETIKVQHRHIEMVQKARCINLKRNCLQINDRLLGLDVEAQKILAFFGKRTN